MRALLEPLRAVADEILVAADSRVGQDDLEQYTAVADRVLRFERGPDHSALAWLHAQCRGEWIFTIAGDEVASPDLIDALPELLRSRDALQLAVPLRWLYPRPDRWLASAPWEPDFHVRLMRNDGTLRFRGLKHELALPVRPGRFLETPLWHLSLLGMDEDARRAKVAANEAERPGLRAPGGAPLNRAYYLPEEHPGPELREVPARDLAAILAVLGAPARPGVASAAPLATRADIEPLWAGRALGEGAYRATVEPWLPALTMAAGERRTVYVRVRNEGDERWPWGEELPPYFRVGGRWRGAAPVPELRAYFPHEVLPGQSCVVPVEVQAPPAGDWTLELGVLHEDVRWFGAPCEIAVSVR